MASTIRCDIVSAEEEIFRGDVQMVVATGEMGELGIAPRHAPLITRLKPGYVRVTLENGDFAAHTGSFFFDGQIGDAALRAVIDGLVERGETLRVKHVFAA